MKTIITESEQEQARDLLWGTTKDLLLPSGRLMTIREQNGDDDDLLSNLGTQKDLSNQNRFIQSIVVKADTKSGKLSNEDVDNLLIKDKYFIMFASRIHSMGQIVNFTYKWGEGEPIEYDDDISKYIWDYSKDFPKKGDEDYYQYMLEPYAAEANSPYTITLQSGKEITFECLKIKDEKALMAIDQSSMTRNRELLQRNLHIKMQGGELVRVQSFRFFSKKDMVELNKKIYEIDSPFMPLTEIKNPTSKEVVQFPIISSPSFFFPEEI